MSFKLCDALELTSIGRGIDFKNPGNEEYNARLFELKVWLKTLNKRDEERKELAVAIAKNDEAEIADESSDVVMADEMWAFAMGQKNEFEALTPHAIPTLMKWRGRKKFWLMLEKENPGSQWDGICRRPHRINVLKFLGPDYQFDHSRTDSDNY